jgi:hypothetical protein
MDEGEGEVEGVGEGKVEGVGEGVGLGRGLELRPRAQAWTRAMARLNLAARRRSVHIYIRVRMWIRT